MARPGTLRDDLHGPNDLRRLARCEKVPRAARRMLAIANAMDGMTFAAAAAVVGMERQALGDAVKRYNAEGVAGLYDRAKPGRTPKLTSAQEAEFAEIVKAGPNPEVDGLSAYTREDLARIVKTRFGVDYHPNGIGMMLRRLGFSRQKPRPFNPKSDAAAQAAFRGAR